MHFVQAEKLYYETALLGKLEQGLGAVLSQRSAGFGAAPHEGLGQHEGTVLWLCFTAPNIILSPKHYGSEDWTHDDSRLL